MKKYEKAGVNISKAEELVSRIKIYARQTYFNNPELNSKVLSDIGHFGAFFDCSFSEFEEPILVSSVDGVGTKVKISIAMNEHESIGQDLVNHCVNDILCSGARPLFFLDYFACGRLNLEVAEKIILGISRACKENNCALIGGEIAEMPDIYSENDYDIAGTIVGVVEKKKIVNGLNIKKGDILIGLKSNGLHTNGYSLARKVLLNKYNLTDFIDELNLTLGEELLKIHKSYFHTVYPLIDDCKIKGISHITGGGIVGNTKRVLPANLSLKIDWYSWEVPKIFQIIKRVGEVSDEEMREVFNLGIGMILIASVENVDSIRNELEKKGEESFIIGEVV